MSSRERDWWEFAATLRERISASLDGAEGGPIEPGLNRLSRWRSQVPFLDPDFLRFYAHLHGVDESRLLRALGEPPLPVGARATAPPKWTTDVQRALGFSVSVGSPSVVSSEDGRLAALLQAIEPFVREAQQRLAAGLNRMLGDGDSAPVSTDTVIKMASPSLSETLGALWIRVLALELNVARVEGTLSGEAPSDRFSSFCVRASRPESLRAILKAYPVLARRTGVFVDNWVESNLELVGRLCSDWKSILHRLEVSGDPGRVTRIEYGRGDRHRGGRSVVILETELDLRFVYKPKPLGIDVHFQELLRWLNDRGHSPPLPTIRVLDCGDYGWCEFVESRPCDSDDELARFYRRQGGYLAILYALEATDIHYENLIARGEEPILIDLETLFHPVVGEPDAQLDPAAAELRSSVLRVGLLPHRSLIDQDGDGVDLSGLGGEAGQPYPFPVARWQNVGTDELKLGEGRATTKGGRNRPRTWSPERSPIECTDSLVAGFEHTYRLLVEHAEQLLAPDGPVEHFADDRTRVVLRTTAAYGSLQQCLSHPDLLRDAVDSELMLAWLCVAGMKEPQLARTSMTEVDEILNGDVPTFVARPACLGLWTSRGECLDEFFDAAPLDSVRRRIRQLGTSDLARQTWFIKAAMTSLAVHGDRQRSLVAPSRVVRLRDRALDPISAARKIGDRISETALRHPSGSISWIGVRLTAKQRWSLSPVGPSLYDGLSGIALFLAYLAMLSGELEYENLARGAIATARSQFLPGEASTLRIGAFDGIGGLAYALAHLGTVWADPDLLADADRIVSLIGDLVVHDDTFDVVSGAAGALACVLAIHEIAPSQRLLTLAETLGDHLLANAETHGGGLAWVGAIPSSSPLTGFAHGASGIGWALARVFDYGGEPRFLDSGLRAFEYESRCLSEEAGNWYDYRESVQRSSSRPFGLGWCHGAPGIALARLQAMHHLTTENARREVEVALKTTMREGFGMNHSLCHGDFGNLEILHLASQTLRTPGLSEVVARVSNRIISDAHETGYRTGIPLAVETPGLMTGLSGIGLGLLRLAAPERVPSVLALQHPTPH